MKEFETFEEVKLATEPRSTLGQTLVIPRFIANLNPCLTYTRNSFSIRKVTLSRCPDPSSSVTVDAYFLSASRAGSECLISLSQSTRKAMCFGKRHTSPSMVHPDTSCQHLNGKDEYRGPQNPLPVNVAALPHDLSQCNTHNPPPHPRYVNK